MTALARIASSEGTNARVRARIEYELAGAFETLGRPDDAREHYLRAVDDDPELFRAARVVNALIREMSVSEGFVLRDTERDVHRIAPHGIPGWESFDDHCHLNAEGLRREATAVLTVSTPEGSCLADRVPPVRRNGEVEREGGPYRARIRRMFDFVSDARNLEGARAWCSQLTAVTTWVVSAVPSEGRTLAAFLGQMDAYRNTPPDRRAYCALAIADGLHRSGYQTEAVALASEASRFAPNDVVRAEAWFQLGVLNLREGRRDQATERFRASCVADASRRDCRVYLQRLSRPGLGLSVGRSERAVRNSRSERLLESSAFAPSADLTPCGSRRLAAEHVSLQPGRVEAVPIDVEMGVGGRGLKPPASGFGG